MAHESIAALEDAFVDLDLFERDEGGGGEDADADALHELNGSRLAEFYFARAQELWDLQFRFEDQDDLDAYFDGEDQAKLDRYRCLLASIKTVHGFLWSLRQIQEAVETKGMDKRCLRDARALFTVAELCLAHRCEQVAPEVHHLLGVYRDAQNEELEQADDDDAAEESDEGENLNRSLLAPEGTDAPLTPAAPRFVDHTT